MITIEEFRQRALSFPEAVELPHFERASFRVRKKIFATLAVDKRIGTLMLTPEDQSVFCSMSAGSVYPVPGKWGKTWSYVCRPEKSKEGFTGRCHDHGLL
jgi:hypothetical protein